MNAFAALRLLPITDHGKDTEILALRHQLTVLERQLGAERVKFTPADRASSLPSRSACSVASCGACGCWCPKPFCDGTAI